MPSILALASSAWLSGKPAIIAFNADAASGCIPASIDWNAASLPRASCLAFMDLISSPVILLSSF